MLSLNDIATQLNEISEEHAHGFEYECHNIPGDVEVLQVTVKDREELPIFVSATDAQILCICYLWGEDELKGGSKAEMMEAMLEMNIPMPLSSFSKIDDKYVVFGALARNSRIEDIAHELEVLSNNALEAIGALADYLE